jgi:hypothetical protein
MKIMYVVTAGEYSDYGIEALFDEESLAKAYIASVKSSDYQKMRIETYNLNPNEKQLRLGYKSYLVRMTKEGICAKLYQSHRAPDDGENDTPCFDIKQNLVMYVFAKDEQHALKIVNKRRLEIKAFKKWGR